MVILISYDLLTPGKDYKAFREAIKELGPWWHHLDSTWLVETHESPEKVYKHLTPFFTKKDNLLVFQVQRNYFGWLPSQAWEWLSSRNF